ncbi:MAG TPA: glycoside hydrolase family 3 N-terminal domain-containing protein, partial [Candidatus Caenarcaniphilales bacterium]
VLPNLDDLSLREMVAQLVMVRASGYLFDHQIQYPAWEPPAVKLQHWLQELGIGGVILLGASAGELALRSRQLQSWAKIPLLLAADIEEGVGQRFCGATWFPPPMAIAAIARQDLLKAQNYANQMGAAIAQEARAVGLNWLLAPVVDVNNNPDNPVINVRAFGETPTVVSQLTTAFLKGAQRYPLLTTAKHFPGHGDTETDSHLELPVLSHSLARLAEIELPPFSAAIAAGVDAVMSAHLQIPALDPDYPATLSYRILTQQLRYTMGFQRLVVTDALVMGAIANQYGPNEAPILALEAGADILLMPLDPAKAIDAVCAAVETGRISVERIRASWERIWRAKHKVFSRVMPCAELDLPESALQEKGTLTLPLELAQSEKIALGADILRDAMQVHCPAVLQPKQPNVLSNFRNLVVVDDILSCNFLTGHSPAITLPHQQGYTLQLIDCHTPATALTL